VRKIKTYNDLVDVGDGDRERLDFIRQCITAHEASDLFKTAKIGNEYLKEQNTTIVNAQKTLVTKTGQIVQDKWSPNHKTASNFFNRFVTQETQYLLGNGVTWQSESTGKKLGQDFDVRLQQVAKAALAGGLAFGFFNIDHVEIFAPAGTSVDPAYFIPLYDENNGSLRAGIRYWRLDTSKPLRATLYEEDGFTECIWNRRDVNGKTDEEGAILQPKRAYKLNTKTTEADGTKIYSGENYPSFPIIPLWGNPLHQSELVGLREKIDAYDLLQNGFVNDLDSAQIYWIIKNANGADNEELAQFLDQLRSMHAANTGEMTDIQPVTIDIPYNAREVILNRLERQLYKDFRALDTEAIAGGAATATQIKAAYEPMEIKSSEFEGCVLDFLYGLLKVAGIEGEKPSFTRTRIVNTQEEVTTVLAASSLLGDEYSIRKVLTLLGDGDKADEIIEKHNADEMERMAGVLNGLSGRDNGKADTGAGSAGQQGVQES
jgi:hypothetical protein